MSSTELSAKLFADACALIPGGVNSPVRAFNSVGGTPRFITSGRGYELTDADGNRYVDLVVLLGTDDPRARAPRGRRGGPARPPRDGLSFGAPTPTESELAAEIIGRVAPGGAGAAGQLRHRGHHERDPAGPRLHRPAQDRQVLGLLPRPRRRAARRRRLRGRDPGSAVVARCDRCGRRRHDRAALQRHPRRRAGIRRAGDRDRLSSSPKPAAGNMGCVPPAPGLQRRTPPYHRANTARC